MLKKMLKKLVKNKRGLEGETLVKWLIGLTVLVLVIVAIVLLSGKGGTLIDKIRSLFMFRG